jgi:N-acetylglucosaminyldiphosphoundecaprenol N-acetyl-beta-D-mannosaminyltransferase
MKIVHFRGIGAIIGKIALMTENTVPPSEPVLNIHRVSVLGLPIDCVTMNTTLDAITGFLKQTEPKLIFTADSNALVNAKNDSRYARIFDEADLITPDSSGVVWALGRYGQPVSERVSGVDLVEKLFDLSHQNGFRIFLLGSGPGVAAKACKNLLLRFPNAVVVGVRDGYFKSSEDTHIANEIALTQPDIVIVAMGMPRQELFLLDNAYIIKYKVGIGVGGSLDVHSGEVKRAPKFIQAIRMEWLWRLILNPKKIDKVKNLPGFYMQVRRETKNK